MFQIYNTLTGDTVAKARTSIKALTIAENMTEQASWGTKSVFEVRVIA